MIVGVPKEIKNHEYRVGMTHYGAAEMALHGHEVIVERDAGSGAGITDGDYRRAGAKIVSRDEIFERSAMIMKVKEPQPEEYAKLGEGQILFTYLHLAAEQKLTEGLMQSGCVSIAYETITSSNGSLPLLTPMSVIAGRMSVQAGAHFLQKPLGGKGTLLSGAPGVTNAKVVIVGGGVVGINAARIAIGMGAEVFVFDKSNDRLQQIDASFGNGVHTLFSTEELLARQLLEADLVIGAVLIPGASAPKLINRKMIQSMEPGSVIVDVAIDQGGCVETARATTHEAPVYSVDDVIHYCVANMPGAVSRTSTFSLTNATLPYALKIADLGWRKALGSDANFLQGLNVVEGKIACEAVSQAFDLPFHRPESFV